MKRFPEARVIDTSKDITDWNHGEIAIGLIHPASAGHGLNLQEGTGYYRVVWIDMVVGIISADECQTLETGAETYRGYTSSDYEGNTR